MTTNPHPAITLDSLAAAIIADQRCAALNDRPAFHDAYDSDPDAFLDMLIDECAETEIFNLFIDDLPDPDFDSACDRIANFLNSDPMRDLLAPTLARIAAEIAMIDRLAPPSRP